MERKMSQESQTTPNTIKCALFLNSIFAHSSINFFDLSKKLSPYNDCPWSHHHFSFATVKWLPEVSWLKGHENATFVLSLEPASYRSICTEQSHRSHDIETRSRLVLQSRTSCTEEQPRLTPQPSTPIPSHRQAELPKLIG